MLAAFLPFAQALIGQIASFIPNPEERAKREAEMQRMLLEMAAKAEADQRAINLEEAKSSSLFVAGWRPGIGWVCTLALLYQYLLMPLASWGFAVAGTSLPPLPGLDENLWQLMFGMLGIGGLRTFEKVKGVAR